MLSSSSGSRSEERSEPVNVGCGNNRSGNDSYSVIIVGEIGGVMEERVDAPRLLLSSGRGRGWGRLDRTARGLRGILPAIAIKLGAAEMVQSSTAVGG